MTSNGLHRNRDSGGTQSRAAADIEVADESTTGIGLPLAEPTLGIDGGVRGEVSDGFRREFVSRN
jgi:hypothetical protein